MNGARSNPESAWDILTALGRELEQTTAVAKAAEPQFARRLFVRSLFSVFDAYASVLSRLALQGVSGSGVSFTPRELERLQEGREEKARDGSTAWRARFFGTRERLGTAIRAYARVRGAQPPLDDENPPKDFETANTVRNRLTHPRRTSDFDISKDEADAIVNSMLWFKRVAEWARAAELAYIERLKRNVSDSINSQIERLRQEGSQTNRDEP